MRVGSVSSQISRFLYIYDFRSVFFLYWRFHYCLLSAWKQTQNWKISVNTQGVYLSKYITMLLTYIANNPFNVNYFYLEQFRNVHDLNYPT
jgi:hypothetical protein